VGSIPTRCSTLSSQNHSRQMYAPVPPLGDQNSVKLTGGPTSRWFALWTGIEWFEDCIYRIPRVRRQVQVAMTGFGRYPRICSMMIVWLSLGLAGQSQTQSSGTGSSADKQTPASAGQKDAGTTPAQAANLSPAERKRAELLADTEKLYQLTQELKAEVAKSNKDTLSVSVVKKAQEVERLAKSIKERSRSQ
jgi:hypothetical protein